MKIDIITIFPQMVEAGLSYSIVARACESGLVQAAVHDLRDHTQDKHRSTDDSPYGGGAGMVMRPEPLFAAVESLKPSPDTRIVLLTPQGDRLTQPKVWELSRCPHLVMLCGHYEGFDERVRDHLATDEISIGDYVLTGGELPALVLTDAIVRLLPGVLGNSESALADTFHEDLLEHPHYTRPPEFRGWRVPDILLSGHHAEIARWRRKEQFRRTQLRRPDLWMKFVPSKSDQKLLMQLSEEQWPDEQAKERMTNASTHSGD